MAKVPSLTVSAVTKLLTPVKVSVPAPDLIRRPEELRVVKPPTLMPMEAPVPPPPTSATVGTVPET